MDMDIRCKLQWSLRLRVQVPRKRLFIAVAACVNTSRLCKRNGTRQQQHQQQQQWAAPSLAVVDCKPGASATMVAQPTLGAAAGR